MATEYRTDDGRIPGVAGESVGSDPPEGWRQEQIGSYFIWIGPSGNTYAYYVNGEARPLSIHRTPDNVARWIWDMPDFTMSIAGQAVNVQGGLDDRVGGQSSGLDSVAAPSVTLDLVANEPYRVSSQWLEWNPDQLRAAVYYLFSVYGIKDATDTERDSTEWRVVQSGQRPADDFAIPTDLARELIARLKAERAAGTPAAEYLAYRAAEAKRLADAEAARVAESLAYQRRQDEILAAYNASVVAAAELENEERRIEAERLALEERDRLAEEARLAAERAAAAEAIRVATYEAFAAENAAKAAEYEAQASANNARVFAEAAAVRDAQATEEMAAIRAQESIFARQVSVQMDAFATMARVSAIMEANPELSPEEARLAEQYQRAGQLKGTPAETLVRMGQASQSLIETTSLEFRRTLLPWQEGYVPPEGVVRMAEPRTEEEASLVASYRKAGVKFAESEDAGIVALLAAGVGLALFL